jgi:hypothetical protein
MRRFSSLLLAASLVALAARGADETASSPWRRMITALPDAEFAEAEIDADLLERSNGHLGAIRVTDEIGATVPYVIATRPPRVESVEIPLVVVERKRDDGTLVAIIDRGAAPGRQAVPPAPGMAHVGGEDRKLEAAIEIQVDGLTWRVPLMIEASRDRRSWMPIAAAEELQSLLSPPPIIAGRIRFPEEGLRFIRISLGPGLPERADFGRIALARETRREEGEWTDIAATVVRTGIERGENGAAMVTLLDLGRPGRLHQRVTVMLPAPDYFRRVEVREVSGEEPDAPWRPLAEGAILKRRRTGETLSRLDYAPSTARYLAVVIRHGDDQPVAGAISVESLKRRLVVPVANGPRFIYYGDSAARTPRYDLAERWTGAAERPAGATMTLGAEEPNPGYMPTEPRTFLERYPWVLTLGLLVGVILLGLIAMGMLKKRPEDR